MTDRNIDPIEIHWGRRIRFLHGNGQTALVNLERGNFMKIRSEAFAIIEEALTNGLPSVTKKLSEHDNTELFDLLNMLLQERYLVDGDNELNDKTFREWNIDQYVKTPKIVYYAVSESCNLSCPFCYADAKSKSVPYYGDLKRSRKIVERLTQLNVVNLILSGGEPLLRLDLFDIVEFAKKKELLVGITTNGTLIGLEQASKLKNSGVDYVQISIESPLEMEHDSLRGKGTFKKCLEAVHLLKEQGYRKDQLYITATSTRKNIATLKQYAEFAERLGVTPGTSFFQPVGRGHRNKVNLTCSEQDMLDFILCKMNKKKDAISASVDIPDNKIADALIPRVINCCGMGLKTLGIEENGTVVPCHLFFSCTNYELGNILDDNIFDKLFSFVNSLPSVDEIQECKDCNVRYFCASGCWAHAYWEYGSINKRSPYCSFYRKLFSAILWNLGMENTMTRIYDELKTSAV